MAFNLFAKLSDALRPTSISLVSQSLMHTFMQSTTTTSSAGGAWSLIPIRTNIRNHFPRPKECKRIRVHGYAKRMSTPAGRRIIWRRILKGTWNLSH